MIEKYVFKIGILLLILLMIGSFAGMIYSDWMEKENFMNGEPTHTGVVTNIDIHPQSIGSDIYEIELNNNTKLFITLSNRYDGGINDIKIGNEYNLWIRNNALYKVEVI